MFHFLNYVKPTWYFNLQPKKDFAYFPTIVQLKEAGCNFVKDENYKSELSKDFDIAWIAFQQGFIFNREEDGLNVWHKARLPIKDEYYFIAKYFGKKWILFIYILIL